MYWDSGLAAAPDIVYAAYVVAKKMNPNYNLIFLDAESLGNYFPYRKAILDSLTAEIKEAHFSDILRTYLLAKYGGVWIDASCFVLRPFSSWLDGVMNENNYFIGRSNSFSDRRIMNWFMASKSGSEEFLLIMEKLLNFFTKDRKTKLKLTFFPEKVCPNHLIGPDITDSRAIKEIENSGLFPYFIYHYFWNDVMNENQELRDHFRRLPTMGVPIVKLNRRLFAGVSFFKNRAVGLGVDHLSVGSNPHLPSVVRDVIIENCD